MRRVLVLTSMCLLLGPAVRLSAQKTPTFDVTGPTIITFFEPATDAELRKDSDTNPALSDFQFYAGQVGEPLAKRGITFKFMQMLTIRQGRITTMFATRTMKVGCLSGYSRQKSPTFNLGSLLTQTYSNWLTGTSASLKK